MEASLLMLQRWATALVALITFAPLGAADHGKPHDEGGAEGEYVEVDVHPASYSNGYDPSRDCTWDGREQRSGVGATLAQVQPAAFDPTRPTLVPLAPKCVSVDVGMCGALFCPALVFVGGGHVAYNTTNGNMTGYVFTPVLFHSFGGNSGVGARFDCEECPPPGALLQP